MPGVARYDAIADFYDATVGDSVSDPATAALLELLGDVGGTRVLDLACGQGRVARELARCGGRVVGVDLSTALLDKARAIETRAPLGITYLEGDVEVSSLLHGETFDSIACNYGLSDVEDLEAVLATVHRLLVPGGRFVFSMLHPSFPGWGADAPSSWNPGRGYFREGWWLANNPGFRGKVGSYFRMLSTYLNAIVGHGLVIEQLVEPPPDSERVKGDPRALVPWYLVIRSSKRPTS
jgi:ubiquinone/menaquinone biosynthesis C-methylase UbiE